MPCAHGTKGLRLTMKHCPNGNTPTAIGVQAGSGLATAHKLGCKSWRCPYCSIKRKGWLARKCYVGIEHYQASGSAFYFGTVTMHENWRGWASIVNFQTNWNKFYQRLKRSTDGPLYYCLLPEKHQDGTLHIHLISTCPQPSRWWKDEGRASGFGYINENEPLADAALGAMYVTKYVHKSLGEVDWPRNFRRVRFSIRWPVPPRDDTWSWAAYPADMARHGIRKQRAKGYKIVNAITGEIVR